MMKKEVKHRMTRQKAVILEELKALKNHPTADELYRLVRRKLPRISLGTVYRNLDKLARAGLIRKLELGNGQGRFDADLSDHYHIRCIKCNRVDDVRSSAQISYGRFASDFSDFEVVGYNLEFVGVCSDCRAKSDERVN